MKKISFFILLLVSSLSKGQEILNLEQCYELAQKNYPLASQLILLEEKNAYELEAINKDYLPRIDLNARATYQSDVIKIPINIGGQTIESLDKDQYKATVDVEQLVFNGGKLEARKELKEAEFKSRIQEVKVNLYQIKRRINNYYFSILQLREQVNLLNAQKDALDKKIRELESQVKHGAALAASGNVLKAEHLKIEQLQDEIHSQLLTAHHNLSAYIGKPVESSTILELPLQEIASPADRSRPEIALFDFKQQELELNKDLLSKNLYPNILGFAQGGYGKPGLNMLDNSFEDFYIVGLKLNWNIFDWGKVKEQKKSLDISQNLIEAEKETFKFNNNLELEEAILRINQIQNLLKKDNDIIDLRERIVETSDSQLTHGTITPSEFLTEFNNLYEAKINRQLHLIQLEKTKADYKVINGNTEN